MDVADRDEPADDALATPLYAVAVLLRGRGFSNSAAVVDIAAARIRAQAERIAELTEEVKEEAAIREKLATILAKVAVALNGPEPPLKRWSYHDLPEKALAAGIETALMRERAEAAERERDKWKRNADDWARLYDAEAIKREKYAGERDAWKEKAHKWAAQGEEITATWTRACKEAERERDALRALLTEALGCVYRDQHLQGDSSLYGRIRAALAPAQ